MEGNHQQIRSAIPPILLAGVVIVVGWALATVWDADRTDAMIAADSTSSSYSVYSGVPLSSLAPDIRDLTGSEQVRNLRLALERPVVIDADYLPLTADAIVAHNRERYVLDYLSSLPTMLDSPMLPVEPTPGFDALTDLFARQLLAHAATVQQMTAWIGKLGAAETPRPGPRNAGRIAGLVSDSSDRLALRTSLADITAPSMEIKSVYDLFDDIPLPCSTPFAAATGLDAMLADLELEPTTVLWAGDARRTLGRLTDAEQLQQCTSSELLVRLATLAGEARDMAESSPDGDLAVRLRQARWAMLRRAGCWTAVDDLYRPPANASLATTVAMRGSSSSSTGSTAGATAAVLRVVHPSVAASARDLSYLAQLTADLERYEVTCDPLVGQAIANRWRVAAASTDRREQALADQIDQHYRNANLRVAVTRELLLKLVDAETKADEPVEDVIAGAPVRGLSHTTSRLGVELIEDPLAWRIGLQIVGDTASNTRSFAPPVVLRSLGNTQFAASKQILLDQYGVRTGPTTAVVRADNQLIGIRSRYEGFPIVGEVVRSQARKQYSQRRGLVRREVEQKATARVTETFDARVDVAIQQAQDRYEEHLQSRLDTLGNRLEPIELQTSDVRLVGRFRVAREDQLAAHTPRPRALNDSLASVQLHQSLLTNLVAGLELDGRRLTGQELCDELAAKFPALPKQSINEAAAATIQFADVGAVVVKFEAGQAKLVLSIAELIHQRRRHRDFRVHVYFEPVTEGLTAKLVHADGPHIEGRMRHRERLRLHGIFGKVIPDDTQITLVPATDDPRFAGLMITQLVLDDGWLGWSIGPSHPTRVSLSNRVVR